MHKTGGNVFLLYAQISGIVSKSVLLGLYIADGDVLLHRYNNDIFTKGFVRNRLNLTFVQRRPNVFDVSPILYKCYTNVLCLLGCKPRLGEFSRLPTILEKPCMRACNLVTHSREPSHVNSKDRRLIQC